MGGRSWSEEERVYFINTVMRRSQFMGNAGEYTPNIGMNWGDLAAMMQAEMNGQGIYRRTYTANLMYEHYYQAVREEWAADHVSMLRDSARAAGRLARATAARIAAARAADARAADARAAGRPPRRGQYGRPRSNGAPTAPPASPTIRESNQRSYGPTGPPNSAVSGPYNMELPSYANDRHFNNFSELDRFRQPTPAPARFPGPPYYAGPPSIPGPPMAYGQPQNDHFDHFGAADVPFLTHAEGAALYHQEQATRRHGRRRRAVQGRNARRTARIINRTPTPPNDDMEEPGLFVNDFEPEVNRRVPAPRPRVELDAAQTMTTIFRSQEMHTLHGVAVRSHQDQAEARRGHMQNRPYEHQPHVFQGPQLPPIINRQNGVLRGQNQLHFDEEEEQ